MLATCYDIITTGKYTEQTIANKCQHLSALRDILPTNTSHGPLTRYVKLRVAHAPGMPGTFSPPLRFSNPDMYHGTCVTHVPWCMLGSLTSGCLWSRWRENVPGTPGASATRFFYVSGKRPMLLFLNRGRINLERVKIVMYWHSSMITISKLYSIIKGMIRPVRRKWAWRIYTTSNDK